MVLALGGFWGYTYFENRIPWKQAKTQIETRPKEAGIKITSVSINVLKSANNGEADFSATAELTEPVYVEVTRDEYLKMQGVDANITQQINNILSDSDSNEILTIAHIDAGVFSKKHPVIIKKSADAGFKFKYSGHITARRQNKWRFEITYKSGDLPGIPLDQFKVETLPIDSPDSAKNLNALITFASQDTLNKLKAADAALKAERNSNGMATIPPEQQPASSDLQKVIKLSKLHMSDDIIINYIRSSGKTFKLRATEILHLSSQGVSQGVISALLATPANPQSRNP